MKQQFVRPASGSEKDVLHAFFASAVSQVAGTEVEQAFQKRVALVVLQDQCIDAMKRFAQNANTVEMEGLCVEVMQALVQSRQCDIDTLVEVCKAIRNADRLESTNELLQMIQDNNELVELDDLKGQNLEKKSLVRITKAIKKRVKTIKA